MRESDMVRKYVVKHVFAELSVNQCVAAGIFGLFTSSHKKYNGKFSC